MALNIILLSERSVVYYDSSTEAHHIFQMLDNLVNNNLSKMEEFESYIEAFKSKGR